MPIFGLSESRNHKGLTVAIQPKTDPWHYIDQFSKHFRATLFSGSGVLGCSGSCHQGRDQLAEEGSAAATGVVNEPEEAEVGRQLVL